MYILTPFILLSHPATPIATFGNHQSVLCIYQPVCILDSTYKWDHMVFVFLWLISLSIILSTSIHVIANGKISFFFLWLINMLVGRVCVCVHHIFFIHLSVYGHLDCFLNFVIVDNAAIIIGVLVSLWISNVIAWS